LTEDRRMEAEGELRREEWNKKAQKSLLTLSQLL
jgi:hypothetical protein